MIIYNICPNIMHLESIPYSIYRMLTIILSLQHNNLYACVCTLYYKISLDKSSGLCIFKLPSLKPPRLLLLSFPFFLFSSLLYSNSIKNIVVHLSKNEYDYEYIYEHEIWIKIQLLYRIGRKNCIKNVCSENDWLKKKIHKTSNTRTQKNLKQNR